MEPFAKSLALVVGVDIYEDGIPSLRNACNDARAISNVLKDWHGYTIEAQLLNIEASRDSLQNEIRKLHDELTQHDRLLFYFAGHGVSLNGVEGPNGYILLSDAIRDDEQSFFLMSDLSESLRSLPCRHLLVVLDCCFAGAMGWSSLRHVGIQTEQLTRELYARYTEKPAWQALSSAAHDERALDVDRRTLAFTRQSYTFAQRPESEDADNSPFAKALIRGLSGKADLYPKSEEGDGIITAHELFVFVDGCLRNLEPHQQTPVLWPLKWPSVGQYVFKVPGSETEIDDLPSAVELTEELNPYQGLEPFTQQESDLFFGRDELTNGLIDRVKNDPLTVVTGASGSGKSSLVRAGLIPEMQEEQEWLILPVIRPLGSLSQALTPLLEMLKIDPDTLDKQGIHALEEPWRDWVKRHAGHRCLLVIDQFEEMITQWQSERDVRRAIHLLREAQVRFGDQLHMVFTIRADFEAGFRGDLESHQDENSKLWTADNLFRVRRMNQAELRAVILKPAASRTLFVDSEVVDGLVEEVFDAPGALPLLSFTLKEMYRSYVADPDGTRELTETHYKNVGGIHGALPKRAESLYRALSRDEKTTLRHVMLRMVTRDAGELVRRRVPRSELTYPGNENKRATAVLRRLQEARLVVTDKAAICGKVGEQRAGMERETASFVEPAHDALIRSWKRLGDWVKREDQREDDIAFQRRLTSSAKTWHTEHYETPHIFKDSRSIWRGIRHVVERAMMWRESTERKGHLYDDASRSDLLAEILDREQPWFNSLETEFTRASIHQNRLNTRIIVGTVIGFVGLAVVILFLGLVANNRGSQLLSRGLAARAEAELSQPEEADPAQALDLPMKQYWQTELIRQSVLLVGHYFDLVCSPFSATRTL